MFKRVLSLILFLLPIAAATWALDPPAPKLDERAAESVQRWHAMLDEEHPQVVLLGNSMLGHGVNAIHFAMRTGLPTVKMWDGGVASAWRYLMFKNLIAASADKPQTVIIFFKDQYLTEPDFRVEGQYKLRLDALRHPSEPLLDQLAYGAAKLDPLAYVISDVWPLDRQREFIKPAVEKWVKRAVGQGLHVGGSANVEGAIARVFSDSNMNKELFTQAQLAAMGTKTSDRRDFKTLLANSFLPTDLEIARKAGIQLVYVRIKRVQDAQTQEAGKGDSYDNSYMKQYMQDLRAYLESNGIPLFDFTTDTTLKVKHYADGDHLNEEGRLIFTRLLAERLKNILPEPRSAERPCAELTELTEPIILKGPFNARAPYGWIAAVPEWEKYASGPGDSYRSVLELLEDGAPLGPRNAYTSDVAGKGEGRYSHWRDAIYFSTSDNSDPNTNGRTYSFRFSLPD